MLLPLRRSKVSVVAVYPAVGHERIVVGEGVVAGVILRSVGQLVNVQPRVAHLLYPRGPWDPERLVPPQRSGRSGGGPRPGSGRAQPRPRSPEPRSARRTR